MSWFVAVLLTVFAFALTQAVYVVSQAVVGWWVGATVEAVSVGFGPVLFEKTIDAVKWRISLFPTGGYTKFYGQGAEFLEDSQSIEADERPSQKRFDELSVLGRAAILLIGPFSSILIGLACLAIPVFVAGNQAVVNNNLPQHWKRNGVPNLTVADHPSTWHGQKLFVESTIVEFGIRVVTFRSLEGWGGFLAWIWTLGAAAEYSWMVWLTCFGATMLWAGAANLVPVPVLNGGHLVFLMVEVAFGRVTETLLIKATCFGMLIVLFVMGRVIIADVNWLWSVR